MKEIPSNLATAIRTVVILVFAWGIVFAKNEYQGLRAIDRHSLVFLVLSGVATGVSWLAYFRALQMAPASRVAPIDAVAGPQAIEDHGWRQGSILPDELARTTKVIADALDACDGIQIVDHALISEASFTLDDLQYFQRWDWDYRSHSGEPGGEIAPSP